MSFTIKKENKKLIFNDLGGYESRNYSTIWCITQADKIYNWNDFPEIKIHTQDYEINKEDYTYSKRNSYKNLIPDFNFHCWKEVGINDYEDMTNEISNSGLQNFEYNKVGWIGSTNTNIIRKLLLNIGNVNKEIFDIFDMQWNKKQFNDLEPSKYISLQDLVKKYSILIDVEGYGYSGRLKYLLWSHRPVIIVDRPHKEFFFEHLVEWKHYIPVKRNLSDLIEKTQWCRNNYDKASEIAQNAYEFSKIYLTRQSCYKQYDKIISAITI